MAFQRFTVILTLLIPIFQTNRLSDRMDRQIEKRSGQVDKLSDKIDRIGDQHHKDVLMLMEQIVALNDRMAKIESR